jgi:hypothetical protein
MSPVAALTTGTSITGAAAAVVSGAASAFVEEPHPAAMSEELRMRTLLTAIQGY